MKFTTLCLQISMLFTAVAPANSYVDAGVPGFEQVWTGADYSNVHKLLKSKDIPLPMLGDEQGSLMLKKICDDAHLEHLIESSASAKAFIKSGQEIANTCVELLTTYESNKRKSNTGHSEAAFISAFILRLNYSSLIAYSKYSGRKEFEELENLRGKGLFHTLRGAITQLNGCPWYSEPAVIALLSAIKDVAAISDNVFTEVEKAELLQSLKLPSAVVPANANDLLIETTAALEKINTVRSGE